MKAPRETTKLRKLRLPPTGNVPCVLYANFNLYWAGEIYLVLRNELSARRVPTYYLQDLLISVNKRVGKRLFNWGFRNTIQLLEEVNASLERGTVKKRELIELLDALIVYVNRLQCWVDRMIPWQTMDKRIQLL